MKPSGICLALSLLLQGAAPALADLVNCNGVWTNKPCGSKSSVSRTLTEIPYQEPTPEEQALLDKKKLLAALETTMLIASSKGAGGFDTSVVKQLCLSTETSTDQCQDLVLNKEKEVNAALVAVSQNPPQIITEPAVSGPTNVTAIQYGDDWDDDIYWDRRRPHHHRFGPRDGTPRARPNLPDHTPGPGLSPGPGSSPPTANPPPKNRSRGSVFGNVGGGRR